ncbi:MAG: hypothetical protein FD162_2145 [Rhodobacteraceae bacterium]|nr:MAG: hypothetical protein FD162_2145 [Paracoccaceae bacterium]
MIRAAWLAIIALAFVVVWQTQRIGAARADLSAATAQLEGYRAADRWRVQQQAAQLEAVALDNELSMGVGADAPLSDYLRGAVGRVWP